MKNLDVDPRTVRLEVEKLLTSGPDMVTFGKLPQTPRAKHVIEYAMAESRVVFKHSYIGTEHLLLGLLRVPKGIAAQVLMNLGVTLEQVRAEVLSVVGVGIDFSPDRMSPSPASRGVSQIRSVASCVARILGRGRNSDS